MRPTRIALLFLTIVCAWTLSAQKHPNIELGFNADRLYHYTELDSVNLFNGNLIIQIPIGGAYHTNGGLQYQLTLVYNAKVWDYRRENDGTNDYVYSDPNWRSNAGVGWRLSLGRLLAPSFVGSHYAGNDTPSWIYEGPSGEEHVFFGMPDAALALTADQSHLRMLKIDNYNRDIEFPGGEIHRFSKTSDGRWELKKISDRQGNYLEIEPLHVDGKVVGWNLHDSTNRDHSVTFASPAALGLTGVSLETDDSVDQGQLVSSVSVSTLEGFSTYQFQYQALAVMWGCGHHPSPYADSDLRTPTVTLPMLKSVVLPDGTDFSFNYYANEGQNTGAGPCGQAMMQDMTVPTGGTTTYEYQIYRLPQSFCFVGTYAETNPGVKARITPDGRWDYGLTLGKPLELTNQQAGEFRFDCGNEYEVPGFPSPPVTVSPPRHWSRTTVLSPAVPYKTSTGYVDRRQRTDNYFYVWFEVEPALNMFSLPVDPFAGSGLFSIGRPFTSAAPADASADALCTDTLEGCVSTHDDVSAADTTATDARHLSTHMYEGCANDGSCSGGQLLRSTYLRASALGPLDSVPYDSSRTVFEDDNDFPNSVPRWIQRESTDPDGAGHFRREEMTTNFPEGGGFITTTNYLGMTDTAANNANTRWLLELFDSKTRTENGATTKSEYCFDTFNGFLKGVRVLKDAGRGATDVLTKYEADNDGNVRFEETYGGDVQHGWSTDNACDTSASTPPLYRIFNTYSHGQLAKSHYCDPAATRSNCASILTTLDLTIDTSGMATASRDSAGVQTDYDYYSDGRLKSVTPAGGAKSSYEYTAATTSTNAFVVEKVDAGGPELLRSSFEFDRVGRLIQLKKSLPGGTFSVVDTEYDALSRKHRISQPYASNNAASRTWTETWFDAMGRPLETIAPDGKKVKVAYTGDRIRQRTAAVATSISGTTDATVTEVYDGQSRLKRVEELAANTSAATPTGGLVTTSYGYDAGNHLSLVQMTDGTTSQERTFDYDGLGFMRKEKHPENGETFYSDYDPRGHAGKRTNAVGTVEYQYDPAERLTKVLKGGTSELLKQFVYANANTGDNKAQGKLVTAIRRNQLPSAGTIDVTETYTYAGKIGTAVTGQLSSRKTLVESVQGANRSTIQQFDYVIDQYDELRLPKIVSMPTCSANGCVVSNGIPSITYTRTAGYLTSVGTFGTLAYHPSGMVHTVTHGSSPAATDTYDTADGMARPSKITFGGGSCTSLQTPVITVGAVCTTAAATASVATVAGVTHTWSITGGTFTTPATGDSVSFTASGSTVALTVTATNSCGQTAPATKNITAGGAPDPSPITAPAGLCNGASGSASVPARDGITHAWSISGGTITTGGTGESITFLPAGPGLVTLSVTATSACGSTPSTRPVVVSSDSTATLSGGTSVSANQSTQIPVELTGIGPWTVVWNDGTTEVYQSSPGYRTVSPGVKTTYTINSVRNAFNCAGTASGSFVVDITQSTPQSVVSYQKYHSMYSPSHAADLWIDMAPAPVAKNAGEWHEYVFKWFENDGVHPVRILNGTEREIWVQPDGNAVYWAEITGTHGVGDTTLRTEFTVSPHMYVKLYGDCHMPALNVSQSQGTLDANSTQPIRFNASVDWPNVDYQWYRGPSGDTRSPINSDSGIPGQLTVPPHLIRPYWVRASLDCGTTQDSPSLIYTMGSCGPVLINQQVASKNVAFGGNTSLNVDLVNAGVPEFDWYEGEGELHAVAGGTQQTLGLTNVQKSGRYWVRVHNTSCNVSAPADSFIATVRVSSCPTITPPSQWPTEFWTDLGSPATLSVSAGGAVAYQWFKGEVGDESQLISGATQSSYVTESLSTDTKYWVRVYGTSSCIVDSPTITVKICEPPHVTGTFSTNENIVPGQWASFHIPMAGTDLHYRWYEGDAGITTHPVGQPVDKLMVHPNATTHYWVDVWAACGPNGSSERHYAPAIMPIFTASVCPVVSNAPTAAQSVVMPGGTTVLSVDATGTGLQYQWYVGNPGDPTSTPLGSLTSNPTITTPPITQNTTFWVSVKSGNCTVSSAEVTVAICPTLFLGLHASHPNVGPGYYQVLSLTGTPEETPLSYQWYKGAAGDTSTPISSQAGLGVSPMVTTSYWVRVTMTDTNCFGDSPVVTINVCAPSITTQPTASTTIDKTSNPSASVHLTVAADITGVTYQWYIGLPGNTSNPIAGATSSSYDASPSATTTYWVRVTGSCIFAANSTAATVSVCYAPAISAVSPTREIPQGGSTPINVTATGTNLTFKWYIGASGNTSNPVANSSTAGITVSPSSTTTYWAQIKSEGMCSANSPTVTVNVCTAPSFTTQPQSRVSFAGNPVTLTAAASASTGPVTYQWYQGLSGDIATPLNGATSSSLTVSPTLETSYWVRATAAVCTTDSAAATISMCTYPEVITLTTSEKYVGYGENATLQLPPMSPVDNKYVAWYRGASGDHANPVGAAQNFTSYTTLPLTSDTQYWAEVTHNTCVSHTTTYTVHVCVSAITSQPTGGTIQSGQNTTLTVGTTAISGQTFQWYTSPVGNTTAPVAGATSSSVTVSPTTTTTYWVRVTGPCGNPVDSAAATVTVCTPPVITNTFASPAAIQAGSSTTLSVSATAVSKTYQWYIGASGTTTNPVTNGTGGSITVSPATTTTYWVQVKSQGFCPANSPSLTVDVCTTPVITTQPQSQLIPAGQSATLTVATSTSGATIQWYQGAPGTTTTPLGTTPSISATPSADTQYWARVTKGACSIDSNGATITVCALTVTLPNVNAASGQNAALTATVTNARAAVIYTWYRGNTGDTTTPAGTTGVPTITVNRTANTNYWVRVTDGTCTRDSATATLFICVPTITTQPQSSTIISGQSTTLTVAATGSPLTYQWYVGDSGVTTSPISGATGSSYTTPALTTLTKYWVKVTGCSAANSATATVTVCIAPSTPSAPTKSAVVNPGNAAWVSISASGTGLTYQWYKGQSGDTSNPISGATSATYNFTLSVSQYYWVRVSGTCGSPANSSAILYSVMPTITVQPQNPSIPYGASTTLSVTATGNFLTYQWFNAGMQPIAGATAASYTTPAITNDTTFYVRVYSGPLTAYPNPASVTLCMGPSVWLGGVQHSTHSYTLIMNVDAADAGNVKFQWYTGTPGNVSQSTPQGTIGGQSQWYLGNVTQQTTWWVRAWYLDDHCYTDTQGVTVN